MYEWSGSVCSPSTSTRSVDLDFVAGHPPAEEPGAAVDVEVEVLVGDVHVAVDPGGRTEVHLEVGRDGPAVGHRQRVALALHVPRDRARVELEVDLEVAHPARHEAAEDGIVVDPEVDVAPRRVGRRGGRGTRWRRRRRRAPPRRRACRQAPSPRRRSRAGRPRGAARPTRRSRRPRRGRSPRDRSMQAPPRAPRRAGPECPARRRRPSRRAVDDALARRRDRNRSASGREAARDAGLSVREDGRRDVEDGGPFEEPAGGERARRGVEELGQGDAGAVPAEPARDEHAVVGRRRGGAVEEVRRVERPRDRRRVRGRGPRVRRGGVELGARERFPEQVGPADDERRARRAGASRCDRGAPWRGERPGHVGTPALT